MIKLTPSRWQEILCFAVLDPDGWDRKNYDASWATPLTFKEFMDRADESTCTKHLPREILRQYIVNSI